MPADPMTITGDKELLKMFDSLEDRVYRKHVAKAEQRAVKPLIQAARANIGPHTGRVSKKRRAAFLASNKPMGKTGNLRKSIGRVTRRYVTGRAIVTVVGPRTGPRYGYAGNHGHLVEFGHRLVTHGTVFQADGKTRKAKTRFRHGAGIARGRVPAKPFMRPAYEATKRKILAVTMAEILRGVESEAKKRA